MKRVLLIKLGALGDIVISTAHIQVLMEQHREDQVTLITSEPFTGLFSAFRFHEVIAIPRKGLLPLLKTAARVWRGGFDAVYDLQTNDRTALLVLCSRAPFRLGMGERFFYTHHEKAEDRASLHIFERVQRLFATAGLPEARPVPVFGVTETAARRVSEWLTAHCDDQPFVVMHAGCSPRWLSKRWPEENFLALAQKLQAAGVQTVWIGGPDDREINARLCAETGIDAAGVFSFEELVALARRARCAFMNDSGPMHILAAADIPLYAFFGPTNWRRSHAVGQADHVLCAEVECSPCFLEQCPPEKKHACMRNLTPELVWERLQADGVLEVSG